MDFAEALRLVAALAFVVAGCAASETWHRHREGRCTVFAVRLSLELMILASLLIWFAARY